jgi:predicted transcriptional regulator
MPKHNKLYFKNRENIKKAYIDYLKKYKIMPSQSTVAEITGLTQTTVSMHLKDTNLSEITAQFKILGESVLVGLQRRASEGDAAAAKLFMFLVFDKTERQELKVDVNAKVKADVKTTVKIPNAIAKRIGDEMAKEGKTDVCKE